MSRGVFFLRSVSTRLEQLLKTAPRFLPLMDTASLLTEYEKCPRAAWYALQWERYKLTPVQMLQRGVHHGLLDGERKDVGQSAGEHLFSLAVEPGLLSDQHDLHSEVVHLSALADVVVSALRKPSEAPWRVPEPLDTWEPSCLLSPDGSYLRRVYFASSWSDDRHYDIWRAWASIGNVCHYSLPMQICVILTGQHRNGRYSSPWTRGIRHPVSKQLRFRKRTDKSTPFKNSWIEVAREDFDEISTQDWLQSMYTDAVLQDYCFTIDLPVPSDLARQRVLDLAQRKLAKIDKMKSIPDENLSSCSWPTKCTYISPCHKDQEPSGRFGFVKVEEPLSR